MAESIARMVAYAERVAAGRSNCERTATAVAGLSVRRSTRLTALESAIFDPKFYLLLQGRKSMIFRERRLDYAAGRYAVSSVGIPFTTQVTEASAAVPYLGVELSIDAGVVAGLLHERPDLGAEDAPAVDTAEADDDILEALERLLQLTIAPHDIAILAPAYERELCYRLLSGPLGGTMRQVVPNYARFARIRTAIDWISRHATEPMRVSDLAASVGMSPTTFHRHFRAVTDHSPLAYQRLVRLLAARERLLAGDDHVTGVAHRVGYASASQFSREYKRLFGVSPVEDAHPMRTLMASSGRVEVSGGG